MISHGKLPSTASTQHDSHIMHALTTYHRPSGRSDRRAIASNAPPRPTSVRPFGRNPTTWRKEWAPRLYHRPPERSLVGRSAPLLLLLYLLCL
jgi:hypothetical protein